MSVPTLSLRTFAAGDAAARARFSDDLMRGLQDYGFIILADHGVPEDLLGAAYARSAEVFALPEAVKRRYAAGMRGYTPFGTEHAKDSTLPDLKEFWQIGRPDVPDDHPVHRVFGPNFWPAEVPDFGPTLVELYRQLDHLGGILLEAAALHIGEPADRFRSIARDSSSTMIGARPSSGSSSSSSSGLVISARAIASICCSPPES